MLAKRRDSTYQPGERSSDWVKLKLEQQQELVIGGYRPQGSTGLDAQMEQLDMRSKELIREIKKVGPSLKEVRMKMQDSSRRATAGQR